MFLLKVRGENMRFRFELGNVLKIVYGMNLFFNSYIKLYDL